MSRKGDLRASEIFKRRVRELLEAGYSASAIAKETGKSYAHTRRVVEWIKSEMND